jgi:hypothetical protein
VGEDICWEPFTSARSAGCSAKGSLHVYFVFKMKLRPFLFLLTALALSCNSSHSIVQPSASISNWTIIATVGGLDCITQMHIAALLRSHGIESLIEGSVVYGVSVPEKDAARGVVIIREDLQRRHYSIDLWDGSNCHRLTISTVPLPRCFFGFASFRVGRRTALSPRRLRISSVEIPPSAL